MKNLSSEIQIFTEVEMTTLENLIVETEVSPGENYGSLLWSRDSVLVAPYSIRNTLSSETFSLYCKNCI